jgi:hypothetical protein
MPLELITMIGGSITGFIFRYLAERAKERHEIYKRAIGLKKAEDDSADKAAARVPIDVGKWVRRLIVCVILFGVVIAPFILSLLGLSTIVQVEETGTEYLFGLFGGGTEIAFVEMKGFLMSTEVRQTLTAIVGFYFGNATAAAKT